MQICPVPLFIGPSLFRPENTRIAMILFHTAILIARAAPGGTGAAPTRHPRRIVEVVGAVRGRFPGCFDPAERRVEAR